MDYKRIKKICGNLLIYLFIAIAIVGITQWCSVIKKNSQSETILPNDPGNDIEISMGSVDISSDKWEREFPSMDDPNSLSTYTGTTFTCILHNKIYYDIKDWTLKITVHDECYFNGFWGGTMEFHQFRNGEEIVDSIDSNTPDLSKLSVEYNTYAEPLLINMLPGDYVVYIPAENVVRDFNRDSYYLIKNGKDDSRVNSNGKGATSFINENVINHCDEKYQEKLQQFLELSTLKERVDNKKSLAMEYKKADGGWNYIRIIDNTKNSKYVLILVEDITREKEKLNQEKELILQSENDKRLRGNFLTNVSYSLSQLVSEIHASNNELRNQISNENYLEQIEKIYVSTEHLRFLQNCILDMFAFDIGDFELREQAYSIREVVDEVSRILKPFYIHAPYEYIVEIDDNIEDKVFGDADRIKQILILLLFSPLIATKEGSVKLIVYGKSHDNDEDLIFSIRDTGEGIPPEYLTVIKDSLEKEQMTYAENAGFVYIKIIDSILKSMGSNLNIVSVLGDGTEMYFSLNQKLTDGM